MGATRSISISSGVMLPRSRCVYVCICVYVYIHIICVYIYTMCVCIYIYIYIYIMRCILHTHTHVQLYMHDIKEHNRTYYSQFASHEGVLSRYALNLSWAIMGYFWLLTTIVGFLKHEKRSFSHLCFAHLRFQHLGFEKRSLDIRLKTSRDHLLNNSNNDPNNNNNNNNELIKYNYTCISLSLYIYIYIYGYYTYIYIYIERERESPNLIFVQTPKVFDGSFRACQNSYMIHCLGFRV